MSEQIKPLKTSIIIEGIIVYMRRNRVGIQCSDGTIYHIHNISTIDCPIQRGVKVTAKCFDSSSKIVDVKDVFPSFL